MEAEVIKIDRSPVRDFIYRNKTTIAVVATAAVCLAIHRTALSQHDEFLKAHDLYDAFYTPDDMF